MRIQNTEHRIQKFLKKLSTVYYLLSTNKKGFTLIELVITMVLIGIIAYIVATAMSTGFKAYFTTDFRKEALDQARIAMERVTREIRNVRSKGSDVDLDGFIDADIGTANASQFCFINTDGTRISFRYANPDISREEGGGACPGGGGNTLSTNITSLTFSYVYAPGAPLTATNVRRVQITLTSTISNESVQLQSEVWPRNL